MAQATRKAFGETLIELVEAGMDVVAVDADLAGSTTTAAFGKVYPDRHFDVGIAEQNMIGVAAGLSLTDKIAFTGSFAVFGTGRCYDQIRNTVCYAKLNVKICPTHSGISVGPDGGSHQMIEDISLMRTLPNMRVLVPADYQSAKAALRLAAQEAGPIYVRLGRSKVEEIYDESVDYSLGGSHVLREGSDITLCACGLEVAEALKAAETLAQSGIEAEVIDVYSIKPLDSNTISSSARKTGRIVSVEEHSIYGGLGSTISELISSEGLGVPVVRMGVQDIFGTSGEPEELLATYGLNAEAIVKTCRDCVDSAR